MQTHFKVTPQQKAAAILIAMGKSHAKLVLEHMKSDELRAILEAGRALKPISQQALKSLVADFERAFVEGSGIIDTADAIDELLIGTNAKDQQSIDALPNAIQQDGAPNQQNGDIWEQINALDPVDIAKRLATEKPYMISGILSCLKPQMAAAVLASIPKEIQSPVLSGMMTHDPKSLKANERLVKNLAVNLGIGSETSREISPQIPEILNALDPSACDALLASLRPSLSDAEYSKLEAQLFRFDDIEKLDKPARTSLLDPLSADLLTDALRDAPDGLREAVLSSIGQRMRKMIEGELANDIRPDPKRVTDARRSIAQLAVKMSSEGKLELPKRAA